MPRSLAPSTYPSPSMSFRSFTSDSTSNPCPTPGEYQPRQGFFTNSLLLVDVDPVMERQADVMYDYTSVEEDAMIPRVYDKYISYEPPSPEIKPDRFVQYLTHNLTIPRVPVGHPGYFVPVHGPAVIPPGPPSRNSSLGGSRSPSPLSSSARDRTTKPERRPRSRTFNKFDFWLDSTLKELYPMGQVDSIRNELLKTSLNPSPTEMEFIQGLLPYELHQAFVHLRRTGQFPPSRCLQV